MRRILLSASALVGVGLLTSSAVGAASYIPVVPPTGAVSTAAFGINDKNIIVGYYTDSANTHHGFFGPLDGSNYTVFDFEGATGTEPRGIGNDGSITGLAKGSTFIFGEEFFRAPDGTINVIERKGQPLDGVAQGLNDRGAFVGDFLDQDGVRDGYKGISGQYKDRIVLPLDGVTALLPRQKNNRAVVTGSYEDSAGGQHGFTLDHGIVNVFDYPGALYTVPEGINGDGVVSGFWTDSSVNRHGFLLDTATGEFTGLDPKDGSTFQQGWGINSKSLVAMNTGNGNSFIYCPHKKSRCPQSSGAIEVHPVPVSGGTFIRNAKHGRTGRNLPPIWTVKKQGDIP